MSFEDYKLTHEGYEKLLQKLQELKQRYAENEMAMSKSIQNATGDGAHDNGEFEALQSQEKVLVSQINMLLEKIRQANIIEIPELTENQINIGDNVVLKLIYDINDYEIDTYQLVGSDGNPHLHQISVNSPIGKAVFGKYIGERIPFSVNDNTFYVEILEKIHNLTR